MCVIDDQDEVQINLLALFLETLERRTANRVDFKRNKVRSVLKLRIS